MSDRVINNEDKLHEKKHHKTINTIQRTVFVERLPVVRRNSNWFIPYDLDNLYPNKIKSISERSVSVTTAIGTHSGFLAGQGFGDGLNEIEVNDDGDSLQEILEDAARNKSIFNGVALHFNYNALGEIVEINTIPFEGLRWGRDIDRLYYSKDWQRVSRLSQVQEYFPFNPESVVNEINEVGIENHPGQVLYYIGRRRDVYPTCRFDAALNDAQFENESSVYKLSAIQNNFNLDGIFKMPPNLFSDDEENEDTINQLRFNHKGAMNANTSMFLPIPNEEYVKAKLFEPIQQQNKDAFFKNQNEEAKLNIYETYQQPPILNGKFVGGGFSKENYIDAFDYYNSKTEDERTVLEKVFNKFWNYTVWANGEQLEIIPKDFIVKREGSDDTIDD